MRRVGWLTLFAVAMGLLEAAVVVYLRELYYPRGFGFPIVLIPERIAVVELIREATTLLMLLAVAFLAGRDRLDRFFVFAYLFGGWDIVYYAGLELFLGWPASWLTWDLLFLIPVPWLSPVVNPLLISVLLVTGFAVHEGLRRGGRELSLSGGEWGIAIAGCAIVVLSFCWCWKVVPEGRTPHSFPWALFMLGVVAGVVPFIRGSVRALRRESNAGVS